MTAGSPFTLIVSSPDQFLPEGSVVSGVLRSGSSTGEDLNYLIEANSNMQILMTPEKAGPLDLEIREAVPGMQVTLYSGSESLGSSLEAINSFSLKSSRCLQTDLPFSPSLMTWKTSLQPMVSGYYRFLVRSDKSELNSGYALTVNNIFHKIGESRSVYLTSDRLADLCLNVTVFDWSLLELLWSSETMNFQLLIGSSILTIQNINISSVYVLPGRASTLFSTAAPFPRLLFPHTPAYTTILFFDSWKNPVLEENFTISVASFSAIYSLPTSRKIVQDGVQFNFLSPNASGIYNLTYLFLASDLISATYYDSPDLDPASAV
eukprot:752492-Hanusia_phi.AAC.4